MKTPAKAFAIAAMAFCGGLLFGCLDNRCGKRARKKPDSDEEIGGCQASEDQPKDEIKPTKRESVLALYKRATDEVVRMRNRRYQHIAFGFGILWVVGVAPWIPKNLDSIFSECPQFITALCSSGKDLFSLANLFFVGRLFIIWGMGLCLIEELFFIQLLIEMNRNVLRVCDRALGISDVWIGNPVSGPGKDSPLRTQLIEGISYPVYAPLLLIPMVVVFASLSVVIKCPNPAKWMTIIGGVFLLGFIWWRGREYQGKFMENVDALKAVDKKWELHPPEQ